MSIREPMSGGHREAAQRLTVNVIDQLTKGGVACSEAFRDGIESPLDKVTVKGYWVGDLMRIDIVVKKE